jgi:CubicO group peptidase (beta-lactamase class C family)
MSRARRRLALVGLGVLAAAALVAIATAPLFWGRYLGWLVRPAALAPVWYAPRERVAGGNQPLAPRVSPESESLDPRSLAAAAAYAASRDARALIVARHDYVVFERYWHGTSFDTLADAQGFTRVLAALAMGAAVSHRRIGWPDQPIGYFIDKWRRDPRGGITVRNLLQMSSGLAAPAASHSPWSAAMRARFGTDVAGATLAEALLGAPGTIWAPQSADPQLLALVLEQATGERYASYLSEAVWRRIGAGDAWLWLDRPGGTAHADCCMLARQGDWIRVAELMLHDGNYRGAEVIHPGWLQLMRTPARSNPDYGMYVRLGAHVPPGSEPYAAADTYLIDGGAGNRLWLVPSMQIAVLRMGGMPRGVRAAEEARLPNLIVSGARDFVPRAAHPGADISAIVPGH